MCELDASADVEEPSVHRRTGCSWTKAKLLGGAVQETGIAQWLRGGGEDEQLRFGREQLEPLREALFNLAPDRLACRNAEPAREFCGVPGAWQFEKRKRVAVTLGDDLLADGRVDRARHVLEQQRPCLVVAEAVQRQGREPGEDAVTDARPRCAHEDDPLGEESTGDEEDDLR